MTALPAPRTRASDSRMDSLTAGLGPSFHFSIKSEVLMRFGLPSAPRTFSHSPMTPVPAFQRKIGPKQIPQWKPSVPILPEGIW